MNRDRLFALVRMQMEHERRRGISFWCDPEVDRALRDAIAAGAPGTRGPGLRAEANRERPAAVGERILALQRATGARLNSAPLVPRATAPPAPPPPPALRKPAATAKPVWGPAPAAVGRDPDWRDTLAALEAEAKKCRQCGLCEDRNHVVFGSGAAEVPLVFVGEAPGAEEDRQGFPFVGRAGELLTRIIAAMGLDRGQVYICNILKCRPPGNRDPLPEEVVACTPYLERQLAILKPKVICSLGRHSTTYLTGETVAMKSVRGRVFEWRGIKVIPTYHPAALLRNPSLKALVWEDVQKVRALLDA